MIAIIVTTRVRLTNDVYYELDCCHIEPISIDCTEFVADLNGRECNFRL